MSEPLAIAGLCAATVAGVFAVRAIYRLAACHAARHQPLSVGPRESAEVCVDLVNRVTCREAPHAHDMELAISAIRHEPSYVRIPAGAPPIESPELDLARSAIVAVLPDLTPDDASFIVPGMRLQRDLGLSRAAIGHFVGRLMSSLGGATGKSPVEVRQFAMTADPTVGEVLAHIAERPYDSAELSRPGLR